MVISTDFSFICTSSIDNKRLYIGINSEYNAS